VVNKLGGGLLDLSKIETEIEVIGRYEASGCQGKRSSMRDLSVLKVNGKGRNPAGLCF